MKNLPENLEFLDLSNTFVGGGFLKTIPLSSKMEHISFRGTQITSYKALEPLIQLKTLKKIDVSDTYISSVPGERRKLERKTKSFRPDVEIIF